MFDTVSKTIFIKNFHKISKEKALAICIVVTLFAMILEIGFSFISHSLMLFSDGIHMLTHALSLMITLLSIIIAKRTKNKLVELVAVTINSMALFYFGIFIFFESIDRFMEPEIIDLTYTIPIAVVGLAVNIFTAVLLNQTGIEDLNTKSAFAHMISDTLLSVSVVLGTVIIYFTGLYFIDALLSIIVSVFVVKWAVDLLKSTATTLKFIESTPLIYEQGEKSLE